MALQKRLPLKKGKEIVVKYENKRFMVKHTEISQSFVTVDVALDNYYLSDEETKFILESVDALERLNK